MDTNAIKRNFAQIDRSANPQQFVDYLDMTTALDSMQRLKSLSYESMRIERGHTVLDLGCGAGDDVRMLAGMVGPQGKVVGVDYSELMVGEAIKRVPYWRCPQP
jgi:ubiquinone/menaquinone biosynthesis C-methylase UbiE